MAHYILTRTVSDPPMTFTPSPDFPLMTDIRVGCPGSTGRFDASSCIAIVPQGNSECSGDNSGDVSNESTFSSDNVGCFVDGATGHKIQSKHKVYISNSRCEMHVMQDQ